MNGSDKDTTSAAAQPHTSGRRARSTAKRLLVASVGVATLHYVGSCKDETMNSVANLMAAPFAREFPVTTQPPVDNARPEAGKDAADTDAGDGHQG